jgi:hypothetical protein
MTAATGVAPVDPAEKATVFAGVILLLVGVLSIIQGVAALAKSSALADAPHPIVLGSSTWGTALIVLGIAAPLVAMSLWLGAATRWVACGLAALNAIVQMFFLPVYPLGALLVLALDVVVLYALAVLASRGHGHPG